MHSSGNHPHCDHRTSGKLVMDNPANLLRVFQYLTAEHSASLYNPEARVSQESYMQKLWALTEITKLFQSNAPIPETLVQMCFQMLMHLLLDDSFVSEETPKWKQQEICYVLVKILIKQHGTVVQSLIDSIVVEKLIARFATPNLKERELLVYIVHASYEEFIQLRVTIRKAIGDRFLMAQLGQGGISELLFLMGCFVGGFRIPLREEHLEFFSHVMLPLYQVGLHDTDPLDACALQFVEKDAKLSEKVVEFLVNHWPDSNDERCKPCSQQFFKSLTRFIPYLPNTDNQFNSMHFLLFAHISKCLRVPQLAPAAVSLLCDCNLIPIIASNPLACNHLLYDPLYRIIIGTTDQMLAQKCTALLAQLPRANSPDKAQALKYYNFTPALVHSLN